MRWLGGITDSMDRNLSKLWETVKGRVLACRSPWGHKDLDRTWQLNSNKSHPPFETVRGGDGRVAPTPGCSFQGSSVEPLTSTLSSSALSSHHHYTDAVAVCPSDVSDSPGGTTQGPLLRRLAVLLCRSLTGEESSALGDKRPAGGQSLT